MRFVLGIDADGTIFDTMNIKHKEVFWQCMMERWHVCDSDGSILKEAERINLYSKSRGVNRFPALLRVMEVCPSLSALDKSPLRGFIDSGYPTSNAGLEKYIADNGPAPLLSEVLLWSRDIDRVFSEKTESILPFPGADRCIRSVYGKADVVTVSSASAAILKRDIANAGLADYVSQIMGQENGKKSEQLEAVKRALSPDRVLMIGDAISDYEAAKRAGVYFYPIIPGRENYSWDELNGKYLQSFLNDEYHEKHEDAVYREFLDAFVD